MIDVVQDATCFTQRRVEVCSLTKEIVSVGSVQVQVVHNALRPPVENLWDTRCLVLVLHIKRAAH